MSIGQDVGTKTSGVPRGVPDVFPARWRRSSVGGWFEGPDALGPALRMHGVAKRDVRSPIHAAGRSYPPRADLDPVLLGGSHAPRGAAAPGRHRASFCSRPAGGPRRCSPMPASRKRPLGRFQRVGDALHLAVTSWVTPTPWLIRRYPVPWVALARGGNRLACQSLLASPPASSLPWDRSPMIDLDRLKKSKLFSGPLPTWRAPG
jgi:hypothetical protein